MWSLCTPMAVKLDVPPLRRSSAPVRKGTGKGTRKGRSLAGLGCGLVLRRGAMRAQGEGVVGLWADVDEPTKRLAIWAPAGEVESGVFPLETLPRALKQLLQSEEQIKVVHGSKLGSMLRVKGIELKCTFDTALAWATLQGGPRSEAIRPVLEHYKPDLALSFQEPTSTKSLNEWTQLLGSGPPTPTKSQKTKGNKRKKKKLQAIAEALADIGLEMMLELEKGGLAATYLQEVNASWSGPFYFSGGELCNGSGTPQAAEWKAADEDEELLRLLPEHLLDALHERLWSIEAQGGVLVELALGLGRHLELRWRSLRGQVIEDLEGFEVDEEDLDTIVKRVGEGKFNVQDRAGLDGTLHRISRTRNVQGKVVTMTMRLGRASSLLAPLLEDLTEQDVLLLGPPGVDKTTLLRALAGRISERCVTIIVDPTGEIAGGGDECHASVKRAWKEPSFSRQDDRSRARREAMGRAVENMGAEVVVVDEIGTHLEAKAASTICRRGVRLLATAHGKTLRDLMTNHELRELLGGFQEVILGDKNDQVALTGKKTVTERVSQPVFQKLVEIRSSTRVVIHGDLAEAVDGTLQGEEVQVEERYVEAGQMFREFKRLKDTLG